MGTRPVARTAHFFLYALPRQTLTGRSAAPSLPTHAPEQPVRPAELSTGEALWCASDVDDLATPVSWRFGLVLPKKQARRSVTRSLIRHQAREAVRRHAPCLASQARFGSGLDAWVLRLRAPFDRQQFPSAASEALSAAVRGELEELWGRLTQDFPGAQA